MELAYYSDYAVRLVNSEEPARGKDRPTTVEAVRELFGDNGSAARRAGDFLWHVQMTSRADREQNPPQNTLRVLSGEICYQKT